MNTMTFIATGDAFTTRRIPADGYPGLEELREVIGRHDVKFSNLEMTYHHLEGTPAAVSGGAWAMAEPRCLDDMKRYGFNLFTTANNHTGDYGEGGVLATIRHLRERDMVFSGTGANLAEASRPCYLETRKGRIALVSACSTFPIASMAGGQSGEVPGRPGLNPLRGYTPQCCSTAVGSCRNLGGELTVELLGVRPGNGPLDMDALRAFTQQSADIISNFYTGDIDFAAYSTDSNVPLSLGIPANTIGTVLGALAHTREEWVDISSLPKGLGIVLSLMLLYEA